MTYDRAVVKLPPAATAVNARLYGGGGRGEPDQQGATVTRAPFGRTPDGKAVDVYTLTNSHGMQVRAITYGAIIQEVRVPDKAGALADVTLGYDSLDGYLKSSPYFGAVVGRYA